MLQQWTSGIYLLTDSGNNNNPFNNSFYIVCLLYANIIIMKLFSENVDSFQLLLNNKLYLHIN